MVIKNKRTHNPLEYERAFDDLYRTSQARISSIPKRRWKLVAEPLLSELNAAYISVMGIAYDPVRGKTDYMEIKRQRILAGARHLAALQGPLLTYWAVSNDRQENLMREKGNEKRKTWTEEVNRTSNLLVGMLRAYPEDLPEDIRTNPIVYYTSKEVQGSVFLILARSLLLETQRQVIRLPLGVRDAQGMIMAELMADVWMHAVLSNKSIPRNRKEYEIRKEHVSAVISDITKSNRALFAIFAGGHISDENMAKWADLLGETQEIAYRIQSSDKKRFGALK